MWLVLLKMILSANYSIECWMKIMMISFPIPVAQYLERLYDIPPITGASKFPSMSGILAVEMAFSRIGMPISRTV